ncbi:hypothetical protein [Streptomyces sp. NPDC058672]|uniref:hypothetical protein n=1 Tax=Streptomyces sp. NPDC058672 TaxID=3346591 RepID=UPI0036647D19
MIRIVTRKRLALLEADTHAAFERAHQTTEAANRAAAQHVDELAAVTNRAEHIDAMLAGAVEELGAAQEELLLKGIELRRLRKELTEAREPGRQVFVLVHHGTPTMVYRSCEDAYADTAPTALRRTAHGVLHGGSGPMRNGCSRRSRTTPPRAVSAGR